MGVHYDPNRPYVISGDSYGLLLRWIPTRGLTIPTFSFFSDLAEARRRAIEELFGFCCIHLDERELSGAVREKLAESNLPVIALDQNYTDGAGLPLELTRLCNPETLESTDCLGSRSGVPIAAQLDCIGARIGPAEVQIADDVIFSGKDLARRLIGELKQRGIAVSRIVAGVVIEEGRARIQAAWPDIEIVPIRCYREVHDEVCERDFIAGVPLSGRLLGRDGVPVDPRTSAPYFHPFARSERDGKCFMKEWASLDSETVPDAVREWSRFCLTQSITLWREIERLSGRLVHCSELERVPRGISCDESHFTDHLDRILAEM